MSFAYMREQRGLSQAEVGREIGVDQSAVCLWETGKNFPRMPTLLKLAKLYGCTVDDLLRDVKGEHGSQVEP